MFFPFSCLTFGFFARPPFLVLSGLTFREQDGLPLCNIIAQRNPLAVVGDLVKQPDLIRGEFRLDNRRRVRSFLSAAPANQKRRATVIGQTRLRCVWVVAHGFVAARNRGGSAFAKEGASALTPALVK